MQALEVYGKYSKNWLRNQDRIDIPYFVGRSYEMAGVFKESEHIYESTLKDMHRSVNEMRSAKSQLQRYAELLEDNDDAKELLEKGESLMKRITSWEENLIQPKQKTFQDVINYNNKLNAQLLHLKGYVDTAEPKVTSGATERWADLQKDWQVYEKERAAIVEEEMGNYNTMYKELGLPAVIMSKL
mgnify:CR=1 FL=1